MARIILSTNGSLGDLHPFLAVGAELRARGHDIRFAVMVPFHAAVQAAGFALDPLPNDRMSHGPGDDRAIYGSNTGVSALRAAFRRRILPTLPAKIAALRAACAGADLLVASGLQFPAPIVADLTGIPWASVTVTPLSLPSAFFAPNPQVPAGPPALRLAATRLGWLLGAALLRQIADHAINDVRRSYGLLPRRNLMLDGNMSATFTSVAISSVFLPRPPDWPRHVHMTGFCFWDTPSTWQAPAELTTFLNASGPIIAVSSGSAAPTVHEVFTPFYRTSIDAIRRVGARALVIGAAPGVIPDPLPPDVFALPFAPFSLVYPRCAAVIHHGGIGSVAQALRAAVPMLVVPWGFDQAFNGARVAELGVGQWLPRSAYTPDRVAPLLADLLHTPSYRDRAQQLAYALTQENGVRTLCDRLEALLSDLQAKKAHE